MSAPCPHNFKGAPCCECPPDCACRRFSRVAGACAVGIPIAPQVGDATGIESYGEPPAADDNLPKAGLRHEFVMRHDADLCAECGATEDDVELHPQAGRTPNTPEPAPRPGTARATWSLVMADMLERDAAGAAKYGIRHQHDNGRDHLVDAYQEALDLALYLRAEIEKRKAGTR